MRRIAILALALSLAACKTAGDADNRRAAGAAGGALFGAFVGYHMFGSGMGQIVAALLGATAGGVGGFYAADVVVTRDRSKMERAAYESLTHAPPGATVYWENRETGSAGGFTVLRAFRAADGRACREFITRIMGDWDTIETRRMACRLHNGGWEII